jgi:glycosyltransferase involved in cell wall biosynthesis
VPELRLAAARGDKLEFPGPGTRPYRLAIVLSHPVQYFSPLFRLLARQPEVDLTVLYCSLQGADRMYDPGFGASFSWDVPLLDGYRHKGLRNWWPGPLDGFFSRVNPGIIVELWKGNYDAVIVFGWASVTTWLTFGSAALGGLPWMLYGDSNARDEAALRGPKRRLKKLVLGALFRKTQAFLASGTFNRCFYELYGAPRRKCFDAPWPVDIQFFESRSRQARGRKKEIRAALGIPDESIVFLFVGKLTERKRPLDLVTALTCLRSTVPRIVVALVGEGEQRSLLEAEIARCGLRDACLLGFRNQSELPEMYGMADAFVLPSSRDPRGTVTNEAMACGLPVIVSDGVGVWGPDDIVRNGENGFVYPFGDTRALAEAMRRLATEAGLRQRMGRRSLEIIREFGCDRTVGGILKALASLGSARAGHAPGAAPATLEVK